MTQPQQHADPQAQQQLAAHGVSHPDHVAAAQAIQAEAGLSLAEILDLVKTFGPTVLSVIQGILDRRKSRTP